MLVVSWMEQRLNNGDGSDHCGERGVLETKECSHVPYRSHWNLELLGYASSYIAVSQVNDAVVRETLSSGEALSNVVQVRELIEFVEVSKHVLDVSEMTYDERPEECEVVVFRQRLRHVYNGQCAGPSQTRDVELDGVWPEVLGVR